MDNNNLMLVVAGENGSGKSWISKDILSKYPNVKNVKKYTTRKATVDDDGIDTQAGVNYEVVSSMDYTYENPNNNELYGFNKEEIQEAFDEGYIPCISLTNEDTYNKIVDDFTDKKILLLKIVPYSDDHDRVKQKDEMELTDWTCNYNNMREIINPYFLKNCPAKVAKGVIVRRIEDVVEKECRADLGMTYFDNNSSISEIYKYLYNDSASKPNDKELNFDNGKNSLVSK